jgi:SOS-response transcriptional repressor LexA
MSAIAKRAGYKGVSSIQRYFDPAQFTKEYLRFDIAERFARALVDEGNPRITRSEVLILAGPAAGVNPISTSANAIKVQVVGAIQAGVWREGLEWPPDEQYAISVNIDPRYPIARYTGLEVRGTSMNKTYTEGTVLVCISAIEHRVEPKSGQNVIVRRRNRQGEFEHTVKELEILDNGDLLLWPRSDDPAYKKALGWHPGDVEEQDDLLVTGIVIRAV